MTNDPSNPFDEAAEAAAADTDAALAKDEAKVRTLSWEELKKKLPNPVDQRNIDQLVAIVNGATEHNEKVAALISNVSTLGGTIVKVLSNLR